MDRKIIINDQEEGEVRVAVLEDGRLDDLFIERAGARTYLGNIYKARVVNIEPAIQAVFVDFGGERNGFLHASDVMPFYADDPKDITVYERRPRGRHARIQELLRKGQEVLVQVSKEGIGSKGPTLTTYLSIPGKFGVLMPSLARVGVSRKIRDEKTRARLREAVRAFDLPEGMGFIVRTAGADGTAEELGRDLEYLLSLWDSIVRRVRSSRTPATVYRESDLVTRTMRDLFDAEVEEVVVDSSEVYRAAREFVSEVMPEHRGRLNLYEGARPVFHAFGVEEQIERIYHRRVPLPSGGSLVIEQTEALVAIDVNSGRFKREADLEETAFRLNMEAIPEICRQLRLRDLGGVIVIDMVDMRDLDRRREVERSLRLELRKDRARVRVAPVSEFGIVELTRQRVRPSIKQESHVRCEACRGTGYVMSLESMMLKVLRDLRAFLRRESGQVVEVSLNDRVAYSFLNEKKEALRSLEDGFRRRIIVQGSADLLREEVRLTAR
jgi:ribonuclease E